MIAYFGMGKATGNVSFYDSSGQNEYTFSKPYSEKTAELIDKEVKELMDNAYAHSKKILTENKEGLTKLAELLLEKEVIFSEDLVTIFGPRKSLSREEEFEKEILQAQKDQNGEKKELDNK